MVGTDIHTQNTHNDPMLGRYSTPNLQYQGDFHFSLLNPDVKAEDPACEPFPPELLQNPQLLSLLPRLTSVCFIPDLQTIPGEEQGGIVIKLNETSTTPEELDVAITVIANTFGMSVDQFTDYCNKISGDILGSMCVIDGEKLITLPVQGGNVLMTGIAFLDLMASKLWPPTTMSLDQFMQMLADAKVEAYTDSSVAKQAIKALKESAKLEVMASATTTPTLLPEATGTPSPIPSIETLTPTPSPIATSNLDQLEAPISQTEIDSSNQQSTTELSNGQQTALKIGGLLLFAGLAVVTVKLITN